MKNSAETSTEYYTPKLEDLHVGYELQLFAPEVGHWGWYTLKETDSPSDFIEAMEIDNVRTPYLTKEQIETEGYEALPDLSPYTGKEYKFKYKRDNGHIIPMHDSTTFIIEWHDRMRVNLIIYKQHRSSWDYSGPKVIYEGSCPSINEFRKITAWLGINLKKLKK